MWVVGKNIEPSCRLKKRIGKIGQRYKVVKTSSMVLRLWNSSQNIWKTHKNANVRRQRRLHPRLLTQSPLNAIATRIIALTMPSQHSSYELSQKTVPCARVRQLTQEATIWNFDKIFRFHTKLRNGPRSHLHKRILIRYHFSQSCLKSLKLRQIEIPALGRVIIVKRILSLVEPYHNRFVVPLKGIEIQVIRQRFKSKLPKETRRHSAGNKRVLSSHDMRQFVCLLMGQELGL